MTIREVLYAIEQANNERLARIASGQTDASEWFNQRLDEFAVDCPDPEMVERFRIHEGQFGGAFLAIWH